MRLHQLPLILTSFTALFAQADVTLQLAIRKEQLEGDPKGAIALYEKAVAEAKADRATAAKALVRMAECYQKLGDVESRKIYEWVLRDYADQREPAKQAQIQLAALRPKGTANAGIVNRRVWTLPEGGDIFGSVSPDGRYLPYVNWRKFGDLYLHDLVTGNDRQLTTGGNDGKPGVGKSESQYAEEYAFSRDGKQLVYSWFRGDRYDLRIVNLDGQGLPQFRRILDNEDVDWIGPHDWSPDGKWIAVSLHRQDKSAQIGVVSAQDGTLRILKSVDWRGPTRMNFSADGRFVAYDLPASESGQQRDIFLIAVDGSRETGAVIHASNDQLLGWTPDGTRLLFLSDRTGSSGLWSQRIESGKPAGAAELVKTELAIAANMGITSSGTLYYWSHRPPGMDIHLGTFDMEKGDFVSPPVQLVQNFVGSNSSPDWSPDGKRVAWISRRGNGGSRVVVIGVRAMETGDVREVMPSPNFQLFWSLTWSADGKSFVGCGRDFKGRNGIFRIDAETGMSSLIMEGARASAYAVESPDGKSLYFPSQVSDGREVAVVKRDLRSGEESVLFQRANLERGAVVSPDGRHLLIHEVNEMRMPVAVVLIPTAGGGPRELMRATGTELASFFAWGVDGRSVVLRKRIGGKVERWRMPVDGGQPQKIAEMKPINGNNLRFHPDGKQMVFSVPAPRKPSEIWTLENFLPEPSSSK